MSQLTQHGQHPDADQLTAFVEQALPLHEREQTLAHLAVCANCRAIVARSLPPLDEVAAPQPVLVRRAWFSGWSLAWPAATLAAMAALGFFIVHLHNALPIKSITEAPTQLATNHPPPPVPDETASARAVLKPPAPSAKPLPQNRTLDNVTAMAGLANPQGIGTPTGSETVAALRTQNLNGSALPQPLGAAAGGAGDGQLTLHGAMARPQIPPDRPQPGIFAGSAPATASPAKTPVVTTPSAAQMSPAATPADAMSADANASATVLAANDAASVAALSTTINGRASKTTQPLPSHLPALSTATNGHQVLALDTQNALFFSEDDGNHWTAIPAQWRGRAVRVNLARPAMFSEQNTVITTAASGVGANGGPISAAVRTGGTTLTGTITDATGAVISGASITVSDATTKASRTVNSDRNGRYLVDNLNPGSYQLEAAAPGFQKQQFAVNVLASQRNQTNLTLAVGQATQNVTVETAAPAPPPPAAPRAALKKAAPASPANAATLFEIITDDGGRWTSVDGKAWTQK